MATKTTLNSLVLTHKRIVRALSNVGQYKHTSPLCKNLKLLKIPDIYKLECLKLIHDQLYRQNIIQFQTISDTHGMNTRDGHNLRPIFPHTEVQKRFVTYFGYLQNNALPECLKANLNNTFKNKLK